MNTDEWKVVPYGPDWRLLQARGYDDRQKHHWATVMVLGSEAAAIAWAEMADACPHEATFKSRRCKRCMDCGKWL